MRRPISHSLLAVAVFAIASLSLVQLGDWTSYYLAVLAGVDPTPIAKIDRLKRALTGPTSTEPGRNAR